MIKARLPSLTFEYLMAHLKWGDGVPTMKNTLQSYSKNIDFDIEDDMFYITPDTEYVFGVIFSCGNFSHPIYSVSKASVTSVLNQNLITY